MNIKPLIDISSLYPRNFMINFRDDVMSKRKEQMKIRKDMREKAERQLKET